MKVLGIDTSGIVASVALLEDDKVLFEYTTNYKRTHSITLMPMIEELFRAINIEKSDIDLYAVSSGPGSFTGLRIGSATAKAFAHVHQKPIASIPTLEVLANNINVSNHLICPLIDARKGNVYYQFYRYEKGELLAVSKMKIDHVQKVIDYINKNEEPVILLGDGAVECKTLLIEGITCDYSFAKINNNMQNAGTVAMLGKKYADLNQLDDYLNHVPIYLRKSQAEQELEERQKNVRN